MRVRVGDVQVDAVRRDDLPRLVTAMVDEPRLHRAVTVNLDFLRHAQQRPSFREVVTSADLATADGMPLVWASRLTGTPLPERVTGSDVVQACCAVGDRQGRAVFLLGGAPGVAPSAAHTLRTRYPRLAIAGTASPPFRPLTPVEEEALVDRVNASGATFLFVGLGAPRQDEFLFRWRHALAPRFGVGVGAVLDFLSGRIPRAPGPLQACGLEWLFRLSQEPKRLWRRYLVEDLPIFFRLLLDASRSAALRPVDEAEPAPIVRSSPSAALPALLGAPSDSPLHSEERECTSQN